MLLASKLSAVFCGALMSETAVPKVRFAGFDGEWDLQPLERVAQVNPASTVPDFFEYVDLTSVIGTQMVSHRTEHRETAPSRAQRVAQPDDIFYQTVRPYQKNNHLFEGDGRTYVFSTGYAQLRPLVESRLLFAAVQRDQFLQEVLDRCTGTSFPAIAPSDLQEIEISAPSRRDEQQRIGALFSEMDALIGQHRQRHEQLRQTKVALMQRLLANGDADVPELRFNRFKGAWISRELGELGSARAGVGFPDAEQGGFHGVPFYKVSDMNLFENQQRMTKAKNYVSPEQIRRHRWRPIQDVPAIVFAKVGAAVFLGRKRVVDHPFLVDNNMIGYSLDCKKWDSQFARAVFESLDLSKLVQVGALPSFNPSAVEGMKAVIPASRDEQQAIGIVFARLDELISTERIYVDKLQQVKTGLLQKMFI